MRLNNAHGLFFSMRLYSPARMAAIIIAPNTVGICLFSIYFCTDLSIVERFEREERYAFSAPLIRTAKYVTVTETDAIPMAFGPNLDPSFRLIMFLNEFID